jgi:hypothetical protein
VGSVFKSCYMPLSIVRSGCLSLSICLSVSLSLCLSHCLYLPIYLSLSVSQSLCLSKYLSIHLSLSLSLSLNLSVYISLSLCLPVYAPSPFPSLSLSPLKPPDRVLVGLQVLSPAGWAALMDHVLSSPPPLLPLLAAAYLLSQQAALFSLSRVRRLPFHLPPILSLLFPLLLRFPFLALQGDGDGGCRGGGVEWKGLPEASLEGLVLP